MNEDIIHRPSKRSVPVSKIISLRDITNLQNSKRHDQINKRQKLESLHNSSPFSRNRMTPSKEPRSHVSKTAVSSLLNNHLSNFSTSLSKSHIEPKNTISIFHDVNINKTSDTKQENKESIKVSGLVLDFPNLPEETSSFDHFQFKINSKVDESSLLHQFQLPILHLDNWYKVNQFNILEASTDHDDEENKYQVNNVQKFSELLLLVNVTGNNSSQDVLLINYRQPSNTFKKASNLKRGDRIILNNGIEISQTYKLYKNWKLLIS